MMMIMTLIALRNNYQSKNKGGLNCVASTFVLAVVLILQNPTPTN